MDKIAFSGVLRELNAACAPPRLCTTDEKNSIVELNKLYAKAEGIRSDTTIEEFLAINKAVSVLFKVVGGIWGRAVSGDIASGRNVAQNVITSTGTTTGTRVGFDTTNLQSKLEGYILDSTHPQNQTKAIWFQQALGFDKSNWQQLGSQITFNESTAIATKLSQYGKTFEQVIPIVGKNGKTIDVTFVFMKDNTGTVRLVTGIPTKK
jgi:hypothetical protein